MPITRFEEEISSFLKNLEARKGYGVKVSDSQVERGSTSRRPVLRWNYVNLSAWLTTTILHVLSGERRGALRTQHLCCEVVLGL